MSGIIIRQLIARTIYLAPFVASFLTLPTPFDGLALCALVIKRSLASDTGTAENSILLNFIATHMQGLSEEQHKQLSFIKTGYVIGEPTISLEEMAAGPRKITVDVFFDLIEGLLIILGTIAFLLITFQPFNGR